MGKLSESYLSGMFGESFAARKIEQAVRDGRVMQLGVDVPVDFSKHTFQMKEDEEMKKLAESIQSQGIIEPVIVREIRFGYEIISGHRRRYAARMAGLKTIPVYVADLTDDEAVIAMVDANLRRKLLPSEMGFSFRAKAEALRHMGVKDEKGTTAKQIGNGSGKSGRTVERYIRLTYLIENLLQMVDERKLSVEVGGLLSFLTEEEQWSVYEVCTDNRIKPGKAQAQQLKEASGSLTSEEVEQILLKRKKNHQIVLTSQRLNDYFPEEMEVEQREQIIFGLLETYKQQLRKEKTDEQSDIDGKIDKGCGDSLFPGGK